MGQDNGLSALHVCVAGHRRLYVLLGLGDKGTLQTPGLLYGLCCHTPDIESHVRGYLVVA